MDERPPDVLESLRGPGVRRRLPAWTFAVTGLAALLGLARLTSGHPPEHAAPPAAASASAPIPLATAAPAPLATKTTPESGYGPPLAAVPGTPAGLALSRFGLYAVQADPPRLVRLTAGRVDRARAVAGDPAGVTVDDGARVVWVWATTPGATTVRAYDAATLAPLGAARLPHYTFGAAATGGRLWVGAELGLYRIAPGQAVATRVIGVRAGVYAVAADPRRHRVVVSSGASLVAVDAATGHVVDRRPLPFGKPSVAVVGDEVWVGGYSRVGPHLLHLRPDLARAAGWPAPALATGPGAIVWPGRQVVWVRDGGSETLSCLDARSGALLAQWAEVVGPVASRPGTAYALTADAVVRLSLTRDCSG